MQIGTINNKWSTIWYVYNSAGDYVTQGMPSDFIPRGSVDEHGNFTEAAPSEQTEAYQAIVNEGLQYNSAKISYEIRMDASTSVPFFYFQSFDTSFRICTNSVLDSAESVQAVCIDAKSPNRR